MKTFVFYLVTNQKEMLRSFDSKKTWGWSPRNKFGFAQTVASAGKTRKSKFISRRLLR